MFKPNAAFSGFSVSDIMVAKEFYTTKLDLQVTESMGGLNLVLPNGTEVWVYEKPNHQPATYTVLNFAVDDIDAAVDDLTERGITFERYDGMHQDERGIARGKEHDMGPDIAWFTDPAGNILSVLETA